MLCFSAGLLFKAETSLSSLLRKPLAKHLPRLAPTNNSSLSCAGLCDQLIVGYTAAWGGGMEFYCYEEQNMLCIIIIVLLPGCACMLIFTDPLSVSGPGQCRPSAWPGPPRRGYRRVSGGRETAGTCGERRAEAAAGAETDGCGVSPPVLHPHRNTVPTLSSFPNVTRVLSTHDSTVYLNIYTTDIYIISTQ